MKFDINRLKKIVCKVNSSNPGTGFLIDNKFIMTAKHVLKQEITDSTEFVDVDFLELNKTHIKAKIFKSSEKYDVAILELEEPILESIECYPLSKSNIVEGEAYSTFGFSTDYIDVGRTFSGNINDSNIVNKTDEYYDISLHCPSYYYQQTRNPETPIEGLSGAPVIINNEIKGIIIYELDRLIGALSINSFSDEDLMPQHIIISSFKIEPELESDWEMLNSFSTVNLSYIFDTIGDNITFDRKGEVDKINGSLADYNLIPVIGLSGSGKSGLLKKICSVYKANGHKVLFLTYENLNKRSSDFKQQCKLKNDLKEVLNYNPKDKYYLFIDDLDKISTSIGEANLKDILSNLNYDKWKIIINCNYQNFDKIKKMMNSIKIINLSNPIEIEHTTSANLHSIIENFPQAKTILLNPKLTDIFNNLKVLDLVARNISTLENKTINGVCDLIDWYWEEVLSGTERKLLARKLSELIAEKFEKYLDSSLFQGVGNTIDDLVNDKILIKKDEQIGFSHDLIGDWSRYKSIIANKNQLSEFLNIDNKCDNIIWHNAIKLYGSYLLEKEQNPSKWKERFTFLKQNNKEYLYFDSIIYSTTPDEFYVQLNGILFANNGEILGDFLEKFYYLTSSYNPLYNEFIEDGKIEINYYLSERIPYWFYWKPLITFLYNNKEPLNTIYLENVKIINVLPKVLNTWLRFSKDGWPCRREAALIATMLMENIIKSKLDKNYDFHYSQELIKAIIAAYSEMPAEIERFLKIMCERIKYEVKPKLKSEEPSKSHIPITCSLFEITEFDEPWDIGPLKEIDHRFRKTCLENRTIHPLIIKNPILAKEILLALFIDHPDEKREIRKLNARIINESELCVIDDYEIGTPFYNKFYFKFLLDKNLDEGLDLIITLVNFATSRYKDNCEFSDQKATTYNFMIEDKSYEWYGCGEIYFWYRGFGQNSLLTCSLMALEKYFYEKADDLKIRDQVINKIIINSQSASFLGLLTCFGKYKPELFLNELSFLLTIPELYLSELSYEITNNQHSYVAYKDCENQNLMALIVGFENMKHRNFNIQNNAQRCYIKSEKIQKEINQVIPTLKTKLKSIGIKDPLRQTIKSFLEIFNIENYSKKNYLNGEVVIFTPPEDLERDALKKESENSYSILTFPHKIEEMLKLRSSLDVNEIEEIYEYINNIPDEINELNYYTEIDIICAGIALLTSKAMDWLNSNLDKKEWCIGRLIEFNQNNFNPHIGDYRKYDDMPRYDYFLSISLMNLWINNIEDKVLKKHIGLLTQKYHYKSIKVFVEKIFESKTVLGSEFNRIINLVIKSAFLQRYDGATKEQLDIYNQYLETFSNSSEREELFYDLDGFMKEVKPEKNKSIVILSIILDQVLKYGLDNNNEFKPLISNIINLYLGNDENIDDCDFMPISQLVVNYMVKSANPSIIWKKILVIDKDDHDIRVFSFGADFIVMSDERDILFEKYATIWKYMLDYAITHKINRKISLDLVGYLNVSRIDPQKFWRIEKSEIIERVKESYMSFIRHNCHNTEILINFSKVLTTPAFKCLVKEGICLFSDTSMSCFRVSYFIDKFCLEFYVILFSHIELIDDADYRKQLLKIHQFLYERKKTFSIENDEKIKRILVI